MTIRAAKASDIDAIVRLAIESVSHDPLPVKNDRRDTIKTYID